MGLFSSKKQSFQYNNLQELGEEIVRRVNEAGVPNGVSIYLDNAGELAIENTNSPDTPVAFVRLENHEDWLNEAEISLLDQAIDRFVQKMTELQFESIQPGFGYFHFDNQEDASLASTAVLFPELFESFANESGFQHLMIAVPTTEEVFVLGGSDDIDVGPLAGVVLQSCERNAEPVSSFIYQHDAEQGMYPIMHVDTDTGHIQILDDCVERVLHS